VRIKPTLVKKPGDIKASTS